MTSMRSPPGGNQFLIEIAIDVSAKGQQSEKQLKGFWNGEELHARLLNIINFLLLGTIIKCRTLKLAN